MRSSDESRGRTCTNCQAQKSAQSRKWAICTTCRAHSTDVRLQYFYIPFGRQYTTHETVPHEWFEWTSPSLQGGEGSYDTTTDWSLGSTCYIDLSPSDDPLRPKPPATVPSVRKWPTVIARMKGWLRKRRMSIP